MIRGHTGVNRVDSSPFPPGSPCAQDVPYSRCSGRYIRDVGPLAFIGTRAEWGREVVRIEDSAGKPQRGDEQSDQRACEPPEFGPVPEEVGRCEDDGP
jgi:hypothetical protein